MTNVLKKQSGTRTLTFEVFDLDLDDAAREKFAKDPGAFLRMELEDMGLVINGIVIDEKLRDPKFFDHTHDPTPHPPQIYHCISPPEMESKYITILA